MKIEKMQRHEKNDHYKEVGNNWIMNLPSGIHFRTVAQMIIDKMKVWDACRPQIGRASDLGYEVTQKRNCQIHASVSERH